MSADVTFICAESDLGLHVQPKAFLLGVNLVLQLQLGHFQFLHLAGNRLPMQFLLMLALIFLMLKKIIIKAL